MSTTKTKTRSLLSTLLLAPRIEFLGAVRRWQRDRDEEVPSEKLAPTELHAACDGGAVFTEGVGGSGLDGEGRVGRCAGDRKDRGAGTTNLHAELRDRNVGLGLSACHVLSWNLL